MAASTRAYLAKTPFGNLPIQCLVAHNRWLSQIQDIHGLFQGKRAVAILLPTLDGHVLQLCVFAVSRTDLRDKTKGVMPNSSARLDI